MARDAVSGTPAAPRSGGDARGPHAAPHAAPQAGGDSRAWTDLPALLAVLVAGVLPALMAFTDLARAPRAAWDALADPLLWVRLGTTAFIGAATLAFALPLGLLLAFALTRTDIPARRTLLLLMPLPLFLPPLVHVLSWFGLLGLRGVPAIVFVYVLSFTPLVALMAARTLEQVGREHAETMRLIGGRRLVWLDELRQALPMALVGGALALVFLFSDFAVADFLTSVGPDVTVYADTLYAHHLALRPAAAAGASIPGMLLCAALLAWALRLRRRLGAAVGGRHVAAPLLNLSGLRWPVFVACALPIAAGTIVPVAILAHRTGSSATFFAQLAAASESVRFTVFAGAGAATLMLLAAVPLALLARRSRRPFGLDLLVFLPLAVPPLIYGVGLIRTFNRPGLDALYLGSGVVLVAMLGRYLPLAYLPTGGALERIDPALTDAARLAGAGRGARFRTILLPLMARPLAAAWCMSFCFALRELDTLIMLRAGQLSLTHRLYSSVVFARADELAALALLLALVTLAPMLVFLGLTRSPIRW